MDSALKGALILCIFENKAMPLEYVLRINASKKGGDRDLITNGGG